MGGFFLRFDAVLSRAGIADSPRQYLARAVGLALALSLVSLAVLLALLEPLESLMAAGALAGFIVSFFFFHPYSVVRKREAELERDLPGALRAFAAELNAGVSFEKALEHSSKGHGAASVEFCKVLERVKNSGASIPASFRALSDSFDSRIVKRSAATLARAYEVGKSSRLSAGQGVLSLAREQVLMQRTVSKEFSGKLMFYTLVFISAAALLPAMFQLLVILGSSVLSLTFSEGEAFWITAAFFPVVDALIILLIRMQTPLFLR